MIQPIKNKVLIKPFPSEEKTTGGLFIPDSCKEVNNKATIVAVGNGTAHRPMKFKPGMVVHRVKDHGVPVEENGELFYLMEDVTLLAIN